MDKVSIKSYAVKHKLSIFNVMKMVKSGKLKSIVDLEDGKEMTYIILDAETEKEVQNAIVPVSERESATLHKELRVLRNDVQQLKSEINKLKKVINLD